MNRLAILRAACVAFIVPASAVAGQQPTSRASVQTLTLDSFHDWDRHFTPPVSTTSELGRGHYAVATVSGTFSYWSAINYSAPQKPWTLVCGTPERSAAHKGSAGGDGPVGLDAEFLFARPWTVRDCSKAHLPNRWPNFQMNDGTGWRHPSILGTLPTVPAADHTYSVAAVGHNARLRFRLRDIFVRDNYGLLKISVRPATAADCSSYRAFDFRSSSDCTAALS